MKTVRPPPGEFSKPILIIALDAWLQLAGIATRAPSNAALWSLAIEMRCYVAAGLFAQMIFARSIFIQVLSAAALLYAPNKLILQNLPDHRTALSYFALAISWLLLPT